MATEECPQCGKRKRDLPTHLKQKHGPGSRKQCPFCPRRTRELEKHINRKHKGQKVPDGPVIVAPVKRKSTVSKSEAEKFGDTVVTGTGECPYCHKRKRKLQQHIDKKHFDEARGIAPSPRKTKRQRKSPYERHAETPGIFRLTMFVDVDTKGYSGAKALYLQHKEVIAKLFGAKFIELQDTHLLDSDDNYEEVVEDPSLSEDPVVLPDDAPLDPDDANLLVEDPE